MTRWLVLLVAEVVGVVLGVAIQAFLGLAVLLGLLAFATWLLLITIEGLRGHPRSDR